jgi:holliday junction DNA helicase RuvA
MYEYINGTVTDLKSNAIILECNGIGYFINVSNPYSYEVNNNYKIYLYQQIKEDEHLLFGFKSLEEKELFLKLISVKGLGPKLALPILAVGSINGIKDAIERENILYLKKFPKIGEKLARQIILDLKGKLGAIEGTIEESTNDELVEALLALGYKEKEIKGVILKVDKTKTLEEQIKESLKLLLR